MLTKLSLKAFLCIAIALSTLSLASPAQAELTYFDNQVDHTAVVTGCDDVPSGSLIIPSSHTVGSNTYVVVGIGENAFMNQPDMTSATIPDTVTSMGSSAFFGCFRLAEVKLGASLTEIGNSSFGLCEGLTSIAMPDSVTSIGPAAFYQCTRLASLTIGKHVTSIGGSAFSLCGSLRSVTIPVSVTSIGIGAFRQSNLTRAIFMGNAPDMGASTFFQAGDGFTVYYFNGAAGFTSPSWTDSWGDVYPAVDMGAFSPIKPWLISYGFAYDADVASDPDGDGVSLLMAYALNLDPTINLAGAVPEPMATANQLSITFHGGSAGVAYVVETSPDLLHWTTKGVTVSGPDANTFYTASIATTPPKGFLHLKAVYSSK